MAPLWMFWVVVLLCCGTQLVLAGKRELGPKHLEDWRDYASSQGNADAWLYRRKILSTEVRAGGGTSWFTTPLLNSPNTSYLAIEASCNNNPCQLEIYGTSDSPFFFTPKNFEFIQNVTFETRSFNTTTIKKSYLHFRILALAASQTKFSIYSIKMYHYFCEKTSKYNTVLSQVNSFATNISRLVQCPDNAVANDNKSTNITAKCTPKGNWTFGGQKCICEKGFDSNNQRCSRCSINHYKSTAGDARCQKCSDGKTNNTMQTKCECKEDHYIGDNEDGPCYVVPSAVEGLKIQTVTSTSVKITWRKPRDNGGFNGSLTYIVECYHCINESKCDTIVEKATFFPANTNLSSTYVNVYNLIFHEKYKFKIFSFNGLKNVPSDKWKFKQMLAVVQTTNTGTGIPTVHTYDATNAEIKPECEEKSSNSIVMFFVGGAVTLAMVLIVLFVILIFKRRHQAPKLSTAVDTVEMQNQSLEEPSQNDQELGRVNPTGSETAPCEEVSAPSVYAELNRNQQDGTTNDHTYQKLIKHDLGYAMSVQAEEEPSYEEAGKEKTSRDYTELDNTKREQDDDASYQKLIKK